MKITKALSFKDILIVPNYNRINSRNNVKTKVVIATNFKTYEFNHPMIVANMSDLIGEKMLTKIVESKGLSYMHRFCNFDEQLKILQNVKLRYENAYDYIGVSVGIKDIDKDNVKKFYDEGIRHFCIDIAHGDSEMCINMIKYIKENFNSVILCAGNVATYHGAKRLWSAGADIVKVGIGSGCLSADTRILMSNGVYKNITDVSIGDKVINMYGNPVTVTNVFSTGIKKVNKIKNNIFYKDTYVTPNHNFYVGDLNSVSEKTLNSHGYKSILNQKNKTTPKASKFKWKPISDFNQDVFLVPNKINFDLKKDFNVNVTIDKKNHNIKPSYNIGYIFGTFLGDGCAFYNADLNIGSVSWYFGLHEKHIVDKLCSTLQLEFNLIPKVVTKQNIYIVKLYNKNISKYLYSWGKKSKKHLPDDLIIDNKEYLKGIYDGLIDSDGNIYKRCSQITNTSEKIIELFNVINQIIFGYFPNNSKLKITAGGLKNCNINNCKQGYYAKNLLKPEYRLINDFQIVKCLNNSITEDEIEVFDLTVDCESHSFIANNMIVHNSICSTRIQTGNGVPQLHAIMEVRKAQLELESKLNKNLYFISDGGCSTAGDVCKALCFSDFVMAGNIFSGSNDTPGEIITNGKDFVKNYHGSSTHKNINIEGYKGKVFVKPNYEIILEEILQGIRSCCTYQGVDNLQDLKENVDFVEITHAGIIESGAHDILL